MTLMIDLTEAEFQRQVIRYAEARGWEWMHIETRATPSRQNGPKGTLARGWPDLTLVRHDRLIFAELKTQKAPPPSTEQCKVLDLLAMSPLVEVYVWRPSDLPMIMEVLL